MISRFVFFYKPSRFVEIVFDFRLKSITWALILPNDQEDLGHRSPSVFGTLALDQPKHQVQDSNRSSFSLSSGLLRCQRFKKSSAFSCRICFQPWHLEPITNHFQDRTWYQTYILGFQSSRRQILFLLFIEV